MRVSRAHSIADDLRSKITTGQLQPGQRLPAETELATRYGVSTATLRNALGTLQAEGLVEKIHGRGNFVHPPLRRTTYVGGWGTLDPRTAADAAQRVTIRTTKTTAPKEHPAALLARPEGTALTEILCLTYDGEVPHGLARTYVPHDTTSPPNALGTVTADAPCQGPAARFAVLTPPPAEVRETVCARLPTPDEASTLRIRPTTTVLAITRTTTDATGLIVEAAQLVFPADRVAAVFTSHLLDDAEESQTRP
ncbi:GntR family transcriptional regulator [Streptomyces sp. NPDC047968]|uniref:GntR family transcriptional regulator n=1 Tax=unclassified Streptomyces TaxID=2593676 RepID=UPI0034238C03